MVDKDLAAPPQLQVIIKTSQSESQKNRSESSPSEISTIGLDPQILTKEKEKELDEKLLVLECQIINLEMDFEEEYDKQNNYNEQKRVLDKHEAKLKALRKVMSRYREVSGMTNISNPLIYPLGVSHKGIKKN